MTATAEKTKTPREIWDSLKDGQREIMARCGLLDRRAGNWKSIEGLVALGVIEPRSKARLGGGRQTEGALTDLGLRVLVVGLGLPDVVEGVTDSLGWKEHKIQRLQEEIADAKAFIRRVEQLEGE